MFVARKCLPLLKQFLSLSFIPRHFTSLSIFTIFPPSPKQRSFLPTIHFLYKHHLLEGTLPKTHTLNIIKTDNTWLKQLHEMHQVRLKLTMALSRVQCSFQSKLKIGKHKRKIKIHQPEWDDWANLFTYLNKLLFSGIIRYIPNWINNNTHNHTMNFNTLRIKIEVKRGLTEDATVLLRRCHKNKSTQHEWIRPQLLLPQHYSEGVLSIPSFEIQVHTWEWRVEEAKIRPKLHFAILSPLNKVFGYWQNLSQGFWQPKFLGFDDSIWFKEVKDKANLYVFGRAQQLLEQSRFCRAKTSRRISHNSVVKWP